MENLEHVKDYLRTELEARKSRNRYYSLRSFANALNISSGALSEIINGKRNLGPNKATKIADCLKLTEEEKLQFLALVRRSKKVTNKETKVTQNLSVKIQQKKDATLKVYEFISDPLFAFMIAATEIEDFDFSIENLQKIFNTERSLLVEAIEVLIELQVITFVDGKFLLSRRTLSNFEDISPQAIREFHLLMLEKAKSDLKGHGIEADNVNDIVLTMRPKYLPGIQEEVKKFQEQILKEFGGLGGPSFLQPKQPAFEMAQLG